MFQKSVASENSQKNEHARVYVTSLKHITASSPAKTNWSSHYYSSPPSPVRKALRRLLWPGRINPSTGDDDEPIISDSISDSKHLQNSIMLLTEDESKEEHEVHCCKQGEADDVIRALQKKSEMQIDDGKLQDALHNLNSALALQQKLYGKTHPKTAFTLNRIGKILSDMGEDYRYMAMSALEESLAIRQELEPGSEDTATTVQNLWLLFHQANISSDKDQHVPAPLPPLPF
mmetsp:Transcript_9303/g.14021  ORF Transcript_9303/g.14021 Transcript_9303/m.14021 type:complete len:232 (-) Transcript_9303:148-843(-)